MLPASIRHCPKGGGGGVRPESKLFEALLSAWIWTFFRGGGTMGCHPMLTENTNFVTNALRGDLSTVNVRP